MAKAWQEMHVKEKERPRVRDRQAGTRGSMPWLAIKQEYAFENLQGEASLLDLFDLRRQLALYRAIYDPGVYCSPAYGLAWCGPSLRSLASSGSLLGSVKSGIGFHN